jgi:hypothetical protein
LKRIKNANSDYITSKKKLQKDLTINLIFIDT